MNIFANLSIAKQRIEKLFKDQQHGGAPKSLYFLLYLYEPEYLYDQTIIHNHILEECKTEVDDLHLKATLENHFRSIKNDMLIHKKISLFSKPSNELLQMAFPSIKAPSSFGKNWDKYEQITFAGRSVHGPPVELYCSVFREFTNNLSTAKVEAQDQNIVRRLKAVLSSHESETDRKAAFIDILSRYVGVSMKPTTFSTGSIGAPATTDASVLVPGTANILLFNFEAKNEIGQGGAEPYMENVAYYGLSCHAASQKGLNKKTNLPCLMMNLIGPHIGICGGILSTAPTVQWLSPIYSLYPHEEDEEAFASLACFFKATKIAINSLFAYYQRDYPQGGFPDICKCQSKSLQYDKLMQQHTPHRPLFLGTADGKPCIIKCARRYGSASHRLMASAGFAPDLMAFEELSGRWSIAVFEYLQPENWVGLEVFSLPFYGKTREESQQVLQNLLNAIIFLHQAGYAHGDLRSNNILVHKKELSIRIIDWDWAGKIGEAIYPPSINMELITWPTGVSPNSPIKPEHDMEWYNRIKMDFENNLSD